jgi:hypothetical protein
VLGQFRAIFERRLDPAIEAVEKHKLTIEDKFVIAGYWANLLTMTPAWHKMGRKLYEQEVHPAVTDAASTAAMRRAGELLCLLAQCIARGCAASTAVNFRCRPGRRRRPRTGLAAGR